MRTDYTVTTAQLAEILGVSVELVRLLSRQNILPKSGRNEFDLREAIPSFYRYQSGLTGGDKPASQYEIERTRYMRAKADQAEMDAMLQAGKLGYVDDIMRAASDEILQLRDEIINRLPRRLSMVLIPSETKDKEIFFRHVCRDVCSSIASKIQPKKHKNEKT